MPKGFHFFDTIIRQPPIDDDQLDVADNLEEFKPLKPEDLESIRTDVEAARATGRAVIANFGGEHYECNYTSLEQCAPAATGRPAQCVVNPFYAGAAASPARPPSTRWPARSARR